MKTNFYVFLILGIAFCQFSSAQKKDIKTKAQEFPFSSEHWIVENADGSETEIRKIEHDNKTSIKLEASQKAYLRNKRYKNFSVEFYCHGSFPGLGFRTLDKKNFEYLYLRVPLSSKRDALQYVPIYNGSLPWQLYNYPKYEGNAMFPRKKVGTLPLTIEDQLVEGKISAQIGNAFEVNGISLSTESEVISGDKNLWYIFEPETKKVLIVKKLDDKMEILDFLAWIQCKVDVVEDKMSVYIENMEVPTFVIDKLKRETNRGGISLISDFSIAYFANVSITKLQKSEITNSDKYEEKLSSNYLTKWNVSKMFAKDSVNFVSQVDSLFQNKSKFKPIQADEDGLINISRLYDDMTKTVVLTCNLVSDTDKTVKLNFDYADHLIIVSNTKILFDKGMNFQPPAEKGEEGRVFVDDEQVDLKLFKGANNLIFVLSGDNRQKYNWGFTAKLDSLDGITIE